MFNDFSAINNKQNKLVLLTKSLLIFALFIFYLPLFILPFYNHACTDDYFCGYNLNQLGFVNYQKFIYQHWGSRFSSTFTGSLFARKGFLYEHYYLHSVVFLILNISSTFFLFSVINKYLLQKRLSKKDGFFCTSIFFPLIICTIPQASTFIFWFSSAVTYHLPVILLQVEFAFIIITFNTTNNLLKRINYVVVPLLIFIINGFNESCVVLQGLLIIYLFFAAKSIKVSKVFLSALIVAYIVSSLIVLLAPGNQERSALIDSKNFLTGSTVVTFHILEVTWSVFKTPLFWFCTVISFYYGSTVNNTFFKKIFHAFRKNKWLIPFFIFSFLFLSIAPAVFALKGGVLPDRYMNGVSYFTVLILIFYAFLLGTSVKAEINWFQNNYYKSIINALLILGLLCNTFFVDEYKSLLSAPLYSSILNERENALKNAAASNKIAILNDYNTSQQNHLQKNYQLSSQTMQNLIQQKPNLIFFEDDLATDLSRNIVKDYYQLDTIIVNKAQLNK